MLDASVSGDDTPHSDNGIDAHAAAERVASVLAKTVAVAVGVRAGKSQTQGYDGYKSVLLLLKEGGGAWVTFDGKIVRISRFESGKPDYVCQDLDTQSLFNLLCESLLLKVGVAGGFVIDGGTASSLGRAAREPKTAMQALEAAGAFEDAPDASAKDQSGAAPKNKEMSERKSQKPDWLGWVTFVLVVVFCLGLVFVLFAAGEVSLMLAGHRLDDVMQSGKKPVVAHKMVGIPSPAPESHHAQASSTTPHEPSPISPYKMLGPSLAGSVPGAASGTLSSPSAGVMTSSAPAPGPISANDGHRLSSVKPKPLMNGAINVPGNNGSNGKNLKVFGFNPGPEVAGKP